MVIENFKCRAMNLLQRIAEEEYCRIKTSKKIYSGNNGPYKMHDTDVRNSSHWLITFSYLSKVDNKYSLIVDRLAQYLIEQHKETESGALRCFLNSSDTTNGLIGQAWVIEALAYYAKVKKNSDALEAAKKIARVQYFNSQKRVWEIVDIDGKLHGVDFAFNHELWFAAALSTIENTEEFESKIVRFLDRCNEDLFDINRNGLIKHFGSEKLTYYLSVLGKKGYLFYLLEPMKRNIKKNLYKFLPISKYDVEYYERAYHLFNLYAFAILKEKFPTHKIFKSQKLNKSILYSSDIHIYDYDNMNPYLYGYNSPAFEFPYVYSVFGISNFEEQCNELLDKQMQLTYDHAKKMFSKHTADANTLTASIYMLVRYLDRN